jgi:hypothetical protein
MSSGHLSIDPGSPLVRVKLGSKSPRIHSGSFASQGVASADKPIILDPTSGLEPLTCDLRARKVGVVECCRRSQIRLLKPFYLLRLGQRSRTLRPQWCQSSVRLHLLRPILLAPVFRHRILCLGPSGRAASCSEVGPILGSKASTISLRRSCAHTQVIFLPVLRPRARSAS